MISSEINRDSYDGDGATRDWPITFPVTAITSTELAIYKVSSAGIATLLDANYEVDLTVPQVTYPTVASGLDVLTSEEGIIILRVLPYTQSIDYKNQGALPAQTIEDGMDRLTYLCQQLNEEISRCIQLPVTQEEEVDYATVLADASDAAAAYAVEAATSVSQAAAQVTLAAAQVALAEIESAAAAVSAAQAAASAATVATACLIFSMDGGGTTLSAGVAGDIIFPFDCTLTAWTLLGDASGLLKLDLWKDTYANFPPTDADTITNGHEPEITPAGVKATDTDISDWSDVTVDEGDIIRVNIDSCTTIAQAALMLKYTRT